jgi:hypothetical protein
MSGLTLRIPPRDIAAEVGGSAAETAHTNGIA